MPCAVIEPYSILAPTTQDLNLGGQTQSDVVTTALPLHTTTNKSCFRKELHESANDRAGRSGLPTQSN